MFAYLTYCADSSAGQSSRRFLSQICTWQRTLIVLDFASVSVMKHCKRCQTAFLIRILSRWQLEEWSGGSKRSYSKQFEQCIQLTEQREMRYPRKCHFNEIQLRIYLNTCDWKLSTQVKGVTSFQYLKVVPNKENLDAKILIKMKITINTKHCFKMHIYSRQVFGRKQQGAKKYVVGFKSFRPDELFMVTEIKQLCYFST